MSQSRKRGVIALIIGLIGFMNVVRQQRFETYHAVDVLQFVASGICFGIALTGLMGRLKLSGD